jgi:MoxR-vWA-beta-propeller ternary system domain bpX4
MPNYFLQTIRQLREREAVILYDNRRAITDANAAEVTDFLAEAYRAEAADYPHVAPDFDPVAGLWAANTVYEAAQLLLHRTDAPADLTHRLPHYPEPITAAALLSADLTLRFLPDLIVRGQLIDPDDPLVALLTDRLRLFHYSGVRYPLMVSGLDFSPVVANAGLLRLYADRVVAHKNTALADHPALADEIRAGLGMFAADFWPERAPRL